MSGLLVLPILIPFSCAVASLLAWRALAVQRVLSVVGAVALLAVGIVLLGAVRESGILVMQVGNWPAPYGITLAADLLSAIMVLLAGVSGLPALADGRPYLTSVWVGALGTPLLFDVGVYLLVVGIVLLMLFALAEE